MNGWPASFGGRLAVAFAAAVASVFALHAAVTAGERRDPGAAAPERQAPLPASPLTALGFRLLPVSGVVLLASRLEAIAPDTAPVLEVLADGRVLVRRAPPASRGPAGSPAVAAGVVLPARSLAGLGPAPRGTLIELLGALVDARPVPGDRVRLADVAATPRELAALLTWVP